MRQSLRQMAPAIGAVLLFAAAHAFHDASEGTSHFTGGMLPALPMIVEIVCLSFGYAFLQRRPSSPARRRRTVAQWAAAIGIALVCGAMIAALHEQPPEPSLGLALGAAGAGLGVLALWLLVHWLPLTLRDARLRVATAESMRREAELSRLRESLQPHFLLNTLNAIAGILVEEPQQARRLLVALGDLLRDSLEDEAPVRPLADEIAWLRRYAEILEVRHRGVLRFEWQLSPDVMGLYLPRLLLQPLVENAVKHGALRRTAGGVVTITASGPKPATGRAQLTVTDNGPGLAAGMVEGLGLRLVRERLALFRAGATLRLESTADGTIATIDLPMTLTPAPVEIST